MIEPEIKFARGKYLVGLSADVIVNIKDSSVVERCVNNENSWRETFYPLETYDDVLQHLVYNFLVNGVENINRLEGWADVASDAVEFEVDFIDFS